MSNYESNLDKAFDDDEIETMMKYKLSPPSSVFQRIQDGSLDFNDYDENVGKIIQPIGRKKVLYQEVKVKPKIKSKSIC